MGFSTARGGLSAGTLEHDPAIMLEIAEAYMADCWARFYVGLASWGEFAGAPGVLLGELFYGRDMERVFTAICEGLNNGVISRQVFFDFLKSCAERYDVQGHRALIGFKLYNNVFGNFFPAAVREFFSQGRDLSEGYGPNYTGYYLLAGVHGLWQEVAVADETTMKIWRQYQAQLFNMNDIFGSLDLVDLFGALGSFVGEHVGS